MVDLIAVLLLTDRPIASIAFHAKGDILAVASGHKVYILGLEHFIWYSHAKRFFIDLFPFCIW